MQNINEENLFALCERLSAADADLAFIFERYGAPPLWRREPGFATLVHIILEQQVSLASALAAFNKLRARLGIITPEAVLSLTDEELKAAYFSRQKTVYVRHLAAEIAGGGLDLKALETLPDEQVKSELKRIKGIGDWTADIYLLMALGRPDVMPRGDLALHTAWQRLKKLPARPASEEFLKIAERWQPLRAVAAHLLWHFYLSEQEAAKGTRK